jgi:tetratricopeptide (TPR) repeat protein
MSKRSLRISALVCLMAAPTLLAAPAFAQGKAKAAKKDTGEVKKDPSGVKGISPFWEAVNRGNAAYLARDFDTAISEFREAITKEPQNALGHYRMAEAQLAKGNLTEAEASLTSALRFAGSTPQLKAKIVFVMADLKERAKAYDEAIAKWGEYAQEAAKPEAKGYPATPPERKKRIEIYKQMIVDYGAVKARIAKRLAETTK